MTRTLCIIPILFSVSAPSLLSGAEPAPQKRTVALLPVSALTGTRADRAAALSTLLQNHLRNSLELGVMGPADVEAVLGKARMKGMLACGEKARCLADVGGALAVDELLVGSFGRAGTGFVIKLTRINPHDATFVAEATQTLGEAADQDLVAGIGAVCATLFDQPNSPLHAAGRGVLPREVTQKVINDNFLDIQRCYEAELLRNPTLTGTVQVEWVVGATGLVTAARQTSGELRSPSMVNCMLRAIRAWRFPPPHGGEAVVTYPFTFKSAGP
jgi:hypothetical protein